LRLSALLRQGPRKTQQFATLAAYAKATGQDRHSVPVDWNVFVKAAAPSREDPTRLYRPSDFDFSLRRGSAAIDRGDVLPGVTDGYTGKAPDLGALEYDLPPPHYGPRPPQEPNPHDR